MKEPEPCPFCGSRPAVRPRNPDMEGNAWGMVVCISKRCPTYDVVWGRGVAVSDGARINDERGSDAYKAAAILRWNKRAPLSVVAQTPTKPNTPQDKTR